MKEYEVDYFSSEKTFNETDSAEGSFVAFWGSCAFNLTYQFLPLPPIVTNTDVSQILLNVGVFLNYV